MSDIAKNAPRLTIVTPSFNQAAFLERTIDSVLSQGHPNLEYFIVDGGSRDGSVDIIRKFERHLAWWVSEPDRGQVHAINKGLERATGEWVGWQNSDDVYLTGAFARAVPAMMGARRVGVVAGGLRIIDSEDRMIRDLRYVTPTWRALRAEGMVIANQSTWWRRDLQSTVGLIDEQFNCSFDYDWFIRLLSATRASYIDEPLGALRMHGETKTSNLAARFTAENGMILDRVGHPSIVERRIYQARRLLGIVGNGHIGYAVKGGLARLRG